MPENTATRITRLTTIAIPIVLALGCFGNGDGPERIPATPPELFTGVLLDSAVQGVDYETSGGRSGTTNAAGEFEYARNESITFSIGSIVLGTTSGAPIITSVELTGSANPTTRAALNQLIFLQSIDSDEEPVNGITISDNTRSLASDDSLSLDFGASDFATAVVDVIAAIAPGNRVVDENAALAHFYDTYFNFGGTDSVSWPFPGFPAVGGGAVYDLVFADEFNEGDVPSPEFWNYETGYGPGDSGWGNNEWQLYTDSTDNVRVEEGNLVISALCDGPCGVRDGSVTSGRITTQDKFEFTFGRIRARIKVPVGEGVWPAFWSLGANFPEIGWPRSGEIDFMEVFPTVSDENTSHFTIHWCDQTIQAPAECSFPEGRRFISESRRLSESLGDDFHVYEAEWTPERIIGKIDGVTYFSQPIQPSTMEEFGRDFFLIFNLAMGGTLGSDNQPPSGEESFPQTMLVDWVRVEQLVGGENNALIDFEDTPDTYDFGESGGFGGGAAQVVDNPDPSGINTSDQVVQMRKFAAEPFGGARLSLARPINMAAGGSARMKVWSTREVMVLLKLENTGGQGPEINVAHGGTGWEELSFDFPGASDVFTGITVIFDIGTIGQAGSDPDNWTFYYDDILVLVNEPTGPVDVIDPESLDFEFAPSTYNFGPGGGFDGGMVTIVDNPFRTGINTSNQVGRMIKDGGQDFGGSTLLLPTPLTLETDKAFTMKVYAARSVNVLFKLEGLDVQAEVTHGGSGWEELTFDFADASGLVTGYTLIFDNGTVGDATNNPDDWTFYFDDITLTDSMPPVVDMTAPVLTTVRIASSNANAGVAAVGDTVTVSVIANEPIVAPTVTIAGEPATDVTGVDTSWSASRALNASDAEGMIAFSVIATDTAGNEADAVTSVTDGSAVSLDATAPTLSIVNAPDAFTSTVPFTVTFQFSEAVSGFGLGDIQATQALAPAGLVTVDAATYTANITPLGSGDVVIAVAAGAAADTAGNPSTMAIPVTVTAQLNPDAPSVTSSSMASDNADPTWAKEGDTVTVDFTTSEEVVDPVVTIAGAPAVVVSVGDAQTWRASKTMLDTDPEGQVDVVINLEDLSGDTAQTTVIDGPPVTYDRTAPALTVDGLPMTVETLDPIDVSFDFGEPVSGFSAGSVALTNAGLINFVDVDGQNYTATLLPDGNGDVTLSIAANAGTDPAGNGNDAVLETRALGSLEPFWQLVWSDQFDGSSLDPANWTARTDVDCPPPCDGEQSYGTDRVSVSGGALTILALEANQEFFSGVVDTLGKRELTYGRVEIDATMPATEGFVPSLRLLPVAESYGDWPTSGDVGIVVAPDLGVAGNQTLEHTLRYGLMQPEDTLTTVEYDSPNPPELMALTYAVEWEAGEIRWFVQGEHVATQTQDNWYAYGPDADGILTPGSGAAPFDEAFYLVLDLAIGSNVDVGGGSVFPQTMTVDEVRVFRCANATDPALGTGCSTGTGVAPVMAPDAPYRESQNVYVDGPATLDFVDPDDPGNTLPTTLVAGTSTVDGAIVNSNPTSDDGGNTVWNVDVSAGTGTGSVELVAPDSSTLFGFFDLSGGETAGELLFRMRVTSATGDPVVAVGLNGDGASGRSVVDVTADGTWSQYAVKIADIVENAASSGPALDLAKLSSVFVLEVSGGTATLDLDDIEVVVTCRDVNGCQATPRLAKFIYGPQDFESIMVATGDPIGDGWVYFNAVFESGNFQFSYNGQAPNGEQICAIATGEGGDSQGDQQFSVYSDYNCCQPNQGHFSPNGLVEVNVFREPRGVGAASISASDVGDTWVFSFDAKRGNLSGTTEHVAFFKVLNPATQFSQTALVSEDMAQTTSSWTRYSVELTISSDWVGQILQFGFQTKAANFGDAGVFYDNIEVISFEAP